MKLSPALYVIHIFGGVRATAKAIGRHHGTVIFWKKPKSKGGSDGRVPGCAQRLILAVAKRRRLDITPEDLIFGREVTILKPA